MQLPSFDHLNNSESIQSPNRLLTSFNKTIHAHIIACRSLFSIPALVVFLLTLWCDSAGFSYEIQCHGFETSESKSQNLIKSGTTLDN